MTNPLLSAVIITYNEEKNIQRCLESVRFCNEMIVVDSGSTDKTVSIAESMGAIVIHQQWLGYGPQKQFAITQAKHNWVLCIDADEVVSDELGQNIQAINLNNTNTPCGYLMPRRNHFLGKPLYHGEGYPDLSLRLFNKIQGHWSKDPVHEGVQVNGRIAQLKGDLLHYSQETVSTYLAKQNHYTQLQAQYLYDRGKTCTWVKCISSPFFRFIKFYFLRLGFLDGFAGFLHISIGCFNTFSKYAKLLELEKISREQ